MSHKSRHIKQLERTAVKIRALLSGESVRLTAKERATWNSKRFSFTFKHQEMKDVTMSRLSKRQFDRCFCAADSISHDLMKEAWHRSPELGGVRQ